MKQWLISATADVTFMERIVHLLANGLRQPSERWDANLVPSTICTYHEEDPFMARNISEIFHTLDMFFGRFVRVGSDQEVNLSGEIRQKILHMEITR